MYNEVPGSVHVKNRVRALVMAGGRAERMRVTSSVHKALVSVLGKPIIQRNLEALFAEAFCDVVVAVSAHAPEIVDYVNTEGHLLASRSGAVVTCLKETKPLGTIGAARLAVGGFDALLVVNVDNLTTLPLRALVEHHFSTNSALTIASHREPFRIPFGELIVNDGRVLDYREKPVFDVLISSGTYVLSLQATGLIEPERRFDITDLFSKVREHALRISAFEHDCTWVDVNDAESLKRATDLFGNQDYVDKAHA